CTLQIKNISDIFYGLNFIKEIRQAQQQNHSNTLRKMILRMKRPAEGGFLQVVSKRMTSAERQDMNREQDAQNNSILSNCKLPFMKIQPALSEN
ncbi:unnamed protein product, partial [Hymenolepis diminuta]